ncbi:energy transducer TonB [Dongshaea marina]|uniref:energy transducer TonB n=1 Tax=Dongshaea marina TaxID=2047966 RepID=UPI000D3E2AB4|nr:energy transducer TonB [Dongshaea marina]
MLNRFLLAGLFAGVITLGTLLFMASLVKPVKLMAPRQQPIEVALHDELPASGVIKKQLPAPKLLLKALPAMNKPQLSQGGDIGSAASLPNLKLSAIELPGSLPVPVFSSPGKFEMGNTFGGAGGSLLTPLFRTQPTYPVAAQRANLRKEVRVEASFVITPLGQVSKIHIDKVSISDPWRRFFVTEVTQALKQWRYNPQYQQGKAVAVPQTVLFKFTPGVH